MLTDPPKTVFIYALKEPDTGEIRYIGKARDPQKRLVNHLSDKENNRRTNWIKKLSTRGVKPVLEIVDEVSCDVWQQWEVAYIEFFRELGCDLVNTTPGGDGCGQGEDHPAFGRVRPEDERKRISHAHTGKKKSLEAVAKSAKARKGLKRSEESCRKISLSHLGVVVNRGRKHKFGSSKFFGVSSAQGKWLAHFSICGHQFYLGSHFSEIEAAQTFDWVAKLFLGDKAYQNFP